ncbi:MAG: hypothetical protein IIW92_09450 [Lachnospiraceae bacterium]|jgi:hypothetical protein|nr:hypothetical protein [Lachnospiraceae bacterium]
MAEYIAVTEQTVAANQNVLFSDVTVCGNCSIMHRPGSGLVALRGITSQCRARYKVFFSGNIAIPTGGTVEAISLSLSIDGEPVGSSTMIVTPAAVEEYFNVASAVFLDVPKNCCLQVAVRNSSTQDILVQNANLIVERVA